MFASRTRSSTINGVFLFGDSSLNFTGPTASDRGFLKAVELTSISLQIINGLRCMLLVRITDHKWHQPFKDYVALFKFTAIAAFLWRGWINIPLHCEEFSISIVFQERLIRVKACRNMFAALFQLLRWNKQHVNFAAKLSINNRLHKMKGMQRNGQPF